MWLQFQFWWRVSRTGQHRLNLTTFPTHMDLSFLPRTFSCINATETTWQGVCVHVCGVRCTRVCPDAIPVLVSGELRVRVLRTPSIYLFQRRSFGVRCTSTSWASRRADPQSAGPRVRTSMQSVGLRGPSRWPWRGRGPPWCGCRGASPPSQVRMCVRAPNRVPGHLLERKRAQAPRGGHGATRCAGTVAQDSGHSGVTTG